MNEERKIVSITNGGRSKGMSRKMSRLVDLIHAIQEMNEKEFTGYLKINFSQGGIGRIEKFEEILRTPPHPE